jgi:hypothetical protein
MKERSIYQYIPTLSEHRPSLFSNFVLQKLTRYRLACSTDEDYADISTSFATRLEARGSDPSIFAKALILVPPRVDLMLRIPDPDKVVAKKFEKGNPIISLCVPRLVCPLGSCIVYADVTALFPSIPIDVGILTVRSILTALNVFPPRFPYGPPPQGP